MTVLIAIIALAIFTIGCERAQLLTNNDFSYNSELQSELQSLDEVPASVSKVIKSVIKDSKAEINEFAKFKIAYFLVPEKHLSLLFSIENNKVLVDKIKKKISGENYVRFFIHPNQMDLYQNLKSSYRLIDQEQSNFMATTLKNAQSLVVWNEQYPADDAFLFSTITNKPAQYLPRIPASLYKDEDDTISITFTNGAHRLNGQELIKLPN